MLQFKRSYGTSIDWPSLTPNPLTSPAFLTVPTVMDMVVPRPDISSPSRYSRCPSFVISLWSLCLFCMAILICPQHFSMYAPRWCCLLTCNEGGGSLLGALVATFVHFFNRCLWPLGLFQIRVWCDECANWYRVTTFGALDVTSSLQSVIVFESNFFNRLALKPVKRRQSKRPSWSTSLRHSLAWTDGSLLDPPLRLPLVGRWS